VLFWCWIALVACWLLAGLVVGEAAAVPSLHDALHRAGATETGIRLVLSPDGLENDGFYASEVTVTAGQPLTLEVTNELSADAYVTIGGRRLGPVRPGTAAVYHLPPLAEASVALRTEPLGADGNVLALGAQGAVGSRTVIAEVAQRVARSTHLPELSRGAALQYLFSAVNLGLAILLLRVRPRDLTARLLAVGLLGTAAVFNLPAHLAYDVLLPIVGSGVLELLHAAFHFVGGGAYVAALLLFPDGRLPYWKPGILRRIPAGAVYLVAVPGLVYLAFMASFYAELPIGRLAFFGLLVPVVGIGGQAIRSRGATDLGRRQQSRVLLLALGTAFGLTLVAGGLLLLARRSGPATLGLVDRLGFEVFPPLFAVIPIALVAVLARYRLWDVDRILNRALVYGVVTGILGLAYVGGVLLLGRSLPLPEDSPLLVATTTLAVAALFRPLRARIQRLVDRRFYRERYDAREAVRAFSTRLRAQVDLGVLCDELLAVVEQTVHPATVTLALDGPAPPPGEGGLSVPLISHGELVGELSIGPSRSERPYSRDDRELLSDLASHAAPAVRVAQLVRRQEAEALRQAQLEHELDVARRIQIQLLPKRLPAIDGWSLAAHYQPAREVGGDFYDVIPLPDGTIGLALGDVTDKGIPAALVMATTHSLVRAEAASGRPPGEVLARVNEHLVDEMPPGMFVTCLYAVLDPVTGGLRFANAGHSLPYRRTGDRVAELRACGMPLGLFAGMEYEQHETVLAPGDGLLLHSDGLAEAHDPGGEMFGLPRLQRLVGEYGGGQELIDGLLAAWHRHTGDAADQDDDITLLTLCRAPATTDATVNANRPGARAAATTC
jgi:serine phosphatase RsbU (regulator of sigma subunit)